MSCTWVTVVNICTIVYWREPPTIDLSDGDWTSFYDRLQNFSRLVRPPKLPQSISGFSDSQVALFNALTNFLAVRKQQEALSQLKQIADELPVELVLPKTTLIKNLIRCLQSDVLRFDALWVLLNLASRCPDIKRAVVKYELNASDSGVVAIMIDMIESSLTSVAEKQKALEALLIFASSSPTSRDYLLENTQTLPVIVSLFSDQTLTDLDTPVHRCAMQVLFSLCQGEPKVNTDLLLPALPIIHTTLQHCPDSKEELLLSTLMSLAAILEATDSVSLDQRSQLRLTQLIAHPNSSIQASALRCLSRIVALPSNDSELLRLLFDTLSTLLRSEQRPLLLEILVEIVGLVMQLLAASTGQRIQLVQKFIVQSRVLQCFCAMVSSSDVKVLSLSLEVLLQFLRASPPGVVNPQITVLSGTISALQQHADECVSKLAQSIVKEFFTQQQQPQLVSVGLSLRFHGNQGQEDIVHLVLRLKNMRLSNLPS